MDMVVSVSMSKLNRKSISFLMLFSIITVN